MKPRYTLKHPDGGQLSVKSGMQIIDRLWGTLRAHLKHCSRVPENPAMTRKLRSAQFEYWHKGQNMWLARGAMLRCLQEM